MRRRLGQLWQLWGHIDSIRGLVEVAWLVVRIASGIGALGILIAIGIRAVGWINDQWFLIAGGSAFVIAAAPWVVWSLNLGGVRSPTGEKVRTSKVTQHEPPEEQQAKEEPPKPTKKSQYIEITDDDDYIEHDGVLWEWRGDEDWDGHPAMEGPLCPRDAVPLQFREAPEEHRQLPPLGGSKYRLLEAAKTPFSLPPIGLGRRAATRDVNENDTIGGFSGGGLLYCLECKDDYRLSTGFSFAGKTVGQSRREASVRFEGKRRRRGA